MTLTELRAAVRRNLKDEDSEDCRWSDDELDRHIHHALREFSQAVPGEVSTTLPTVEDSRQVDISALADLVMIESVEYPVDQVPPCYRRFRVWGSTLVLLDGDLPQVVLPLLRLQLPNLAATPPNPPSQNSLPVIRQCRLCSRPALHLHSCANLCYVLARHPVRCLADHGGGTSEQETGHLLTHGVSAFLS